MIAERQQALLQRAAADRIDDEIDALVVGDAHYLGDQILSRIVNAVIEAERLQPRELVFAGRRRDDDRTRPLRQLDRGKADRAGARLDEDGFTLLQFSKLEET